MGIEDEKKPYEPSREEMKMAEEMEDSMYYKSREWRERNRDIDDEATREELLAGKIPGKEGDVLRYMDRLSNGMLRVLKGRDLDIANIDIQDGKVLGVVRKRDSGSMVAREFPVDKALQWLDTDERDIMKIMDRLETARERIRRQKKQIMEIKEKQEEK